MAATPDDHPLGWVGAPYDADNHGSAPVSSADWPPDSVPAIAAVIVDPVSEDWGMLPGVDPKNIVDGDIIIIAGCPNMLPPL